jgi:tetratricopeptide (TPR) repeat protein
MRFLWTVLAVTAAAVTSAPASANWNVAKSRHFVIYADKNAKILKDFATKLEKFDQGVRAATRMDDPEIGDGNRLTVFVMPTAADVRALMHDKTGFFAGFYTGRVRGSLAYIPEQALDPNDSGALFFHEYTHHLMMQDLDRPYPEWYVEGFAEFFSTPKFDKDGGIWFGLAAQQRAWGLFNGPKLPLQTLFAGLQPSLTNEQREVFYGRGWLLAHYLLMEQRRQGQLAKYVDAIAHGATALDAGKQVFGDLGQLDKELDAYRAKPLLEFKIAASNIHLGPVDVQPLSAGAAQLVLTRAKIKYGAEGEAAEALAAQVRSVESRFSGDELVETTLAEAELDADHADAASAAADRALKANSNDIEALVLKGRAIEKKAKDTEGDTRKNLFEQARQIFIAANKLDTEDPEPLYDFYWSYLSEGIRPTDNAIAALHYASDLAPQDIGVRMNSAIAYLNEGKLKEARSTLSVVAYSPHAKEAAQVAQRMMADIDAGDARAALRETSRPPTALSGSR